MDKIEIEVIKKGSYEEEIVAYEEEQLELELEEDDGCTKV
jgi:hypothetical protein